MSKPLQITINDSCRWAIKREWCNFPTYTTGIYTVELQHSETTFLVCQRDLRGEGSGVIVKAGVS